MWKNIVEPDKPQIAIWRMAVACWIPKATNTHLGYVIRIAFPLRYWLHENASILHYTHTVCPVNFMPHPTVPFVTTSQIFVIHTHYSFKAITFLITKNVYRFLHKKDRLYIRMYVVNIKHHYLLNLYAWLKNKRPTWCHNLLSFISLLLYSTCFGH